MASSESEGKVNITGSRLRFQDEWQATTSECRMVYQAEDTNSYLGKQFYLLKDFVLPSVVYRYVVS